MTDVITTMPEFSDDEPVTIVADPSTADPEAPHGRFASTGRPRKSPPKGDPSAKRRAPRRPAAAPKAPRAAAKPLTAKTAPVDYRETIENACSMAAVALVGMGRKSRAFLADAATVQMNAAPFAQALDDVAQINPGIAKLLQSTAPAVPYIALANIAFQMGAQFAANHGVRLPVPGAQIYNPADLANGMEAQMRAAAEQQAQAEQQAAEDQAEAEHISEMMRRNRQNEHVFAGV